MGLDIYHFHVKDEVTDNPIIIDVSQPQLRNIIHFSRKKTNRHALTADPSPLAPRPSAPQ